MDEVIPKARPETRSAMLLAQLSHEIRAPLMGIRVLMQGLAAGHMPIQLFDEVEQSVQYLLNLSEGYLHRALEQSRAHASPQMFDLSDVVLAAINLVKRRAHDKQLRLLVDWHSIHLRVTGNPLPIQQVLINLLSNAIQYTDQGHVHVAACAAPSASGGAMLTLLVSDTGRGMGGPQAARAFEPFVRLHPEDRHTPGFGLGLSIVKELTEASGGDAMAIDSPHGGLQVLATLGVAGVSPAPAQWQGAACTRQFWILDHSAPARQALTQDLRAMGVRDVQAPVVADMAQQLATLRAGDVLAVDESLTPADLRCLAETLALAGHSDDVLWLSLSESPDLNLPPSTMHVPRLGPPQRWLAQLERAAGQAPAKARAPTLATPAMGPLGRRRLPREHQGKSLLLVEDNLVNQTIVREYLRGVGFEVLTAKNGQEALDVLSHQAIDLVLTDLTMPVLDGVDMVREIRQRGLDLPVMALTGSTEHERLLSCCRAGMTACLSKPLDLDQALLALVAALDGQMSHLNRPHGKSA